MWLECMNDDGADERFNIRLLGQAFTGGFRRHFTEAVQGILSIFLASKHTE